MNIDRLRHDLAELADEATPVDLRDRALRTSRRLGIQRTLATSAAALTMLGAATGTAFALMPPNASGPAPADTPSVTVAPSIAPTPSPSEVPSTGPASTQTGAAGAIGGIFYGPAPSDGPNNATARLYSWRPGGEPRQLLSLSRIAALMNAAVSPDGKRVVWVDDQASLWSANVDGTGERKLRDKVDGNCWGPTWTPDSRRLTVAVIESTDPYRDQPGVFDVADGRFTPVPFPDGCHPVWSAAGRIAAPDGSTGRIVLMDPDGGNQRAIPGLGGNAKRKSLDVASISPDGSRIALRVRGPEEPAGDVGRELDVNAVLDTRTGAEIQLPLAGRELLQAHFQADGSLVARVTGDAGNVLVLISAAGEKISEVPEPAQFKDMQILAAVL